MPTEPGRPENKIVSLIRSDRVWMGVAGVAAVVQQSTIGLSDMQVIAVAVISAAWIIGQSIRRPS